MIVVILLIMFTNDLFFNFTAEVRKNAFKIVRITYFFVDIIH